MEWSRLLSKKTQALREKEPEYFDKYPLSDFAKDYKMIISSAAFRRLQDKTQVFPLDKSDFVRTRLTHSNEVSAIARQLGIMITKIKDEKYKPEYFKNHAELTAEIPEVLSCAGLLHDIGNPPFGHFGEVVIGEWFKKQFKNPEFTYKGQHVSGFLKYEYKKDLCSFEGNAQALRILSKISSRPNSYNINLTYSVMNTLVKYPISSAETDEKSEDVKKHKLGYFQAEKKVFNEICTETGTKISENQFVRHPLTFLVEAADDIAYATADVEDGLKKGMFTVEQFIAYFERQISTISDESKKKKSSEIINSLKERLKEAQNKEDELIAFQKWTEYVRNWLMYVVAFSFSKNYKDIMAGKYSKDLFYDGFHQYTIKFLKGAMGEFVYNSPEILKLELSAHKILFSLMDDFIYAVLYWEDEDDEYKMSKTQKKLVNIISENYKNDYIKACGTAPDENLYLRFLMVIDFISGMTDSYAKNLYQELNGID